MSEPLTKEELEELRNSVYKGVYPEFAQRGMMRLLATVKARDKRIAELEDTRRCTVCNCELQYSHLSRDGGEVYDCPLCKAKERIAELERLVAAYRALRLSLGDRTPLSVIESTNAAMTLLRQMDPACGSATIPELLAIARGEGKG